MSLRHSGHSQPSFPELWRSISAQDSLPSPPASGLRVSGPAPASELIGDALAAVDPAARVERDVPLVLVNGPLACPLDEPHGNTPVREWLRALVQQVLLPLHRAYPLARVVVRRAA